MKFPESKLAHKYLDGLKGIEIGASAHNPFAIKDCIYVDITDNYDTVYKREEIKLCGEYQKVDVVAPAWRLPFTDESLDYVLSSHVLEHAFDTIGVIREWLRVLKPGGLIYCVVPHKARTFDKDRERTTLQELIDRHEGRIENPHEDRHWTVWVTEDGLELFQWMGLDVIEYEDIDSKVGNGSTYIIRKH